MTGSQDKRLDKRLRRSCEGCAKERTPTAGRNRADGVGELMHSDVSLYFVTFKDGYSGFAVVIS